MSSTLFSEVGLLFLFGFIVAPLAAELIKSKAKLVDNAALVLACGLAVVLGFLAAVRASYGEAVRSQRLSVLHTVFNVAIVLGLSQLTFKTLITWYRNKNTPRRAG